MPSGQTPIAELDTAIDRLRPDLGIKIRRSLAGGLSGANVYLVECQVDGEQRLAVLKLASSKQSEMEIQGDQAARSSWLKEYLPERLIPLGQLPSQNKMVLLSLLARDRLEDCQTLEEILKETFGYGVDHVLFALGYAYRQQARNEWHTAVLQPVRDCFRQPIQHEIGKNWLKRWQESKLPGPGDCAVVFDDMNERWPNPVAFLFEDGPWKEHNRSIRIPSIQSQGDLNPRNVLSSSYIRASSQGLIGKNPVPSTLLQNLRLIDMPFCRPLPYPFDLAFLAAALRRTHLPPFDSRARRDSVVTTFKAAIREVLTNRPSNDVPFEGQSYVRCLSMLWGQARMAQEKMEGDIEPGFLACLAAAALWQAIKAVDRQHPEDRDRLAALSALILSALALHHLLGDDARLAGPDFALRTTIHSTSGSVWTKSAGEIAALLETEAAQRNNFILVLGRQCGAYLELPSETDLLSLRVLPPSELQSVLDRDPHPSSMKALQSLGKLPLLAVFDWSVFRHPRTAIANGLLPEQHVIPVTPGQQPEPDWNDRHALFYLHWRGRLEEVPSVAITAPERLAGRKKLRQPLERLAKKRGQNLVVIYVGLPESDLRETHEFLQDIWSNRLKAVFIGSAPTGPDFFLEWDMRAVSASIEDFLQAAADFAQTITEPEARTLAQGRVILVANMARDTAGELSSSPGQTLQVAIPEEDYQAIRRAGHLLLAGDREQFSGQDRNPRDFFIGHRITFAEVHVDVPVNRDHFAAYLEKLGQILEAEKRPRLLVIPSRPGAGASTALRWLAYRTAYELKVPTLVLTSGGNIAFEAIQRLYALVGRSFLVVADSEDVPSDDQQGILSRCAPPRYPVLFLSSRRVYREKDIGEMELPILKIELSDVEKIHLLQRLHQYCPGISLGRLMAPFFRSLFLLILEAFGGENVRVDALVKNLLDQASEVQRFLVAAIAFFSRYAHRPCSSEFLQVLTTEAAPDVQANLESFDQLLVIQENEGWACRHEELSRVVLQYYLTKATGPGDSWRYQLADWVCKVISLCDAALPGGDIVAEYVWAILNPQQEAVRNVAGEKASICRLMQGDDGIPENAMRELVYGTATERFPEHTNIVSHYGKFLSESEGKYAEATQYLEQARQLEPDNEAILHMLGKRYYDEVRQILHANPPKRRNPEVQEALDILAQTAHHWFDQARQVNVGSAYHYVTPIQLNVELIEDEFKRIGIQSASDQPEALLQGRIANLLGHADRLAEDGLRYIAPEDRAVFGMARDRLLELRGDLDTAIRCFEQHVLKLSGSHRATAQVQLARFFLERGERLWEEGKRPKALKDFERGQSYVMHVMQDPTRLSDNLKLWYQCARYMPAWRRQHLLDRLLQLHEQRASLYSAFLLMCLYFADAVETGSTPSWRKHEQFQKESDRLSANLSIRPYIREWLVAVDVAGAREFRVFPHYLLAKETSEDAPVDPSMPGERRIRVNGIVSKVLGPTKAYLKLEPMGFPLFFKPRVRDKAFYASDVGQPVTCAVAFTYEKPIAYDVRKRVAQTQATPGES